MLARNIPVRRAAIQRVLLDKRERHGRHVSDGSWFLNPDGHGILL